MMRFAMRRLCTLILTVLPLALVACASSRTANDAPGMAAQATGLTAQQDRVTDTKVLADRKSMEALQQRLRDLSEAGVAQNNYALAKAQCWLDTAKTQYHENDRTGYIEESMTESGNIIQALEANKAAKVGFETPMVARSTRLRDDLWTEISKFKGNEATLACNARTVACAEIRLVRAGHAQEQTGWRAATPHIMMAEDGLRRAGQEAAACSAPVTARAVPAAPVVVVPVPAAPAAAAPVAPALTKETFVVLGDALFKFDKSSRDHMLPGGLQRLGTIAQRLKSYQSIATLSVVGHTDRLGSNSYNNPLSARRASTVQGAIESMGVKASKTSATGRGKNDPVTTGCSDKLPRAKLIECLQPDRRVTIEVTGVVK